MSEPTDSDEGHAPAARALSPSSLSWRELPEFVITLVAGLVLLAMLVWTPAGNAVGKRIYDQLSIWIGFQASPEVVLVAIDERTRLALGGWPISRRHFATLTERLLQEDQAPRALGLDLLFTNSVPADEPLAEQMGRLPVVLPKVMSQALPLMQAPPAADPWQWAPPALERAARGSGHIHVRFESDGIIRGVQTRLADRAHFSIAMLEAAGLLQSLPLPPDDYLRFPMVDPAVGFRTYSLIDLLDVSKPLPPLRGTLLFLGVTDPVLGDQHATIYSGSATAATPGVAILASVANAHLTQRWVRVVSDAAVMGWSSLALFLVLTASLFWRPGRMRLLIYALALGLPLGATAAMLGWGEFRSDYAFNVSLNGAKIAEGQAAGELVCAQLQQRAALTHVRDRAKSVRSAADAMLRAFSVPRGVFSIAKDDTIVCRCEDVNAKAVRNASALHGDSLRAIKMGCRAGMGPCQGRMCTPNVQAIATRGSCQQWDEPVAQVPLKPVRTQTILSAPPK